jgi:hypothetical protein
VRQFLRTGEPSAQWRAITTGTPWRSMCLRSTASSASVSLVKWLIATTQGRPALAHVLDVPLQVGQALLQRARSRVPEVGQVHAAVVLQRAQRGHDHHGIRPQPDLRHLMSMNFSAPRSAPKPASVTT